MPITPTYPGVYIEEIPSGVRTIVGVATSITAFVGRARSGAVNQAKTINSYGDFEREFGPLWEDSSLGYAVKDFYLNGGSQAIIVRLFHPFFATDTERNAALTAAQAVATAARTAAVASGATAALVATAARTAADGVAAGTGRTAADRVADAAAAAASASSATPATVNDAAAAAVRIAAPLAKARLTVNELNLEAASEGAWGNQLRARIDHDVVGPDASNIFNLSVRDGTTGNIEVFRNVSVQATHPRNVRQVLLNTSTLVRTRGALPGSRPTAHPAPQPGEDIWGNNPTATNASVQTADQSSDGSPLGENDFIGPGQETNKRGLYALEQADLFNLLCIPPYNAQGNIDTSLIDDAVSYCARKRALFIVDPPSGWTTKDAAKGDGTSTGVASLGTRSSYAALFFPRLRQPNPLKDNQMEDFAPCGAIAGIFSRTDNQRGVWKAPAGLEASLVGVPDFSVSLTDTENGELNPLGINCLRVFPGAGRVVWGARTMAGDDRLASEWKYIPVRRLALYIEESLYRGLKWVVFEPNDEPLWAQIRLNVGAFMQNLFRQGAFQGKTPREAYLVKCDRETTTQNDINLGIVNIVVGFAPLKPAEFVILKIQQLAGQIAT